MPGSSTHRVVAAILGFLGVVGVGIALTAVLTSLPAPAAGGTCGPGTASESAAAAFFDPGSIGAGPQPSVASPEAYFQWQAFVGECQAEADGRVLGGLAILVLSIVLLVAGLVLFRRERDEHAISAAHKGPTPPSWTPPSWVQPTWTPPTWRPPPPPSHTVAPRPPSESWSPSPSPPAPTPADTGWTVPPPTPPPGS
ncbi:MAG: hypothetical protein M1115_09555 [Actinobacteria bacterium]|nr:hypothetical protein [Actinomycetota bacterium]